MSLSGGRADLDATPRWYPKKWGYLSQRFCEAGAELHGFWGTLISELSSYHIFNWPMSYAILKVGPECPFRTTLTAEERDLIYGRRKTEKSETLA